MNTALLLLAITLMLAALWLLTRQTRAKLLNQLRARLDPYQAKLAEFDQRIETARAAHQRVRPIEAERRQWTHDRLRGAK